MSRITIWETGLRWGLTCLAVLAITVVPAVAQQADEQRQEQQTQQDQQRQAQQDQQQQQAQQRQAQQDQQQQQAQQRQAQQDQQQQAQQRQAQQDQQRQAQQRQAQQDQQRQTARDTGDISEAAERLVRQMVRPQDGRVDVEVDGDTLVLSGEVNNQQSKQRLLEIANAIRSIRDVEDNVQVRDRGRGEQVRDRSDEQLEQAFDREVQRHARLEARNIQADIQDGRATIRGEVRSAQDLRELERIASNLGIERVDTQRVQVADARDMDRPQQRMRDDMRDDPRYDQRYDTRFDTRDDWQQARTDRQYRPDLYRQRPAYGADDIDDRIQDALEREPQLRGSEIRVEIRGREATLEGEVPSLQAKQVAERIVSRETGITTVRNYLEVDRDREGFRTTDRGDRRFWTPDRRDRWTDDTWTPAQRDRREGFFRTDERDRREGFLRTDQRDRRLPTQQELDNIRRQIETSANLPEDRIDLQVADNRVFVFGQMASERQKDQVTDLVRRHIDNNILEEKLEIAPDEPMSDSDLVDAIERQYFWTLSVAGRNIDVTVRNGTAILSGEVGSEREAMAAIENAYEAGARSVVNRLRVRS
jgi:osmotically-inducible protein OsmY